MVCIYCKHKTQVTNSRLQINSNTVWRRRFCPNCSNIMTTQESYCLSSLLLVKHQKKIEAFNSEKIFLSIYQVLDHFKDAIDRASYLTKIVTNKILSQVSDSQIASNEIFNIIVITLSRYDKLAAKKYSANH